MKSESEFKTQFIKMLSKDYHIVSIENNIGRGTPDINICHNGIEIWIELKIFQAGRVLIRPEQFAWGVRRATHGGHALVAALHPNNRVHFWRAENIFVTPHGKYLAISGLNTSCEFNVDSIKTLLFT